MLRFSFLFLLLHSLIRPTLLGSFQTEHSAPFLPGVISHRCSAGEPRVSKQIRPFSPPCLPPSLPLSIPPSLSARLGVFLRSQSPSAGRISPSWRCNNRLSLTPPPHSSPRADLSSVVGRRALVIPDIPDGKIQKYLSSGALVYRHVYIINMPWLLLRRWPAGGLGGLKNSTPPPPPSKTRLWIFMSRGPD